jgi:hypothetical protein
MKKEADRRETFKTWSVVYIDSNHLAAIGFYFTKCRDVVRCAFCSVEVGHWIQGDDPLESHQRLSPSCRFLRGLYVGNVPMPFSNQPETSLHCERVIDPTPPMEYRPNSGPQRCKYKDFYLSVFPVCKLLL